MSQASSSKHITKFLSCTITLVSIFSGVEVAAQDFNSLRPEPIDLEQSLNLPSLGNSYSDFTSLEERRFESIPIQGAKTFNTSVPESVLNLSQGIVVEKFDFVGNTVFDSSELNQVIADFTNKPISFFQLVQAAHKITEFYVDQGYITTGAYVPEQNSESAAVKIQIIEGSLEDIEVNVTGRLKASYVRDRIAQKTAAPLNINQLQSALQLLQLNPLITSLNAELSAGLKPGTNILTVAVTSADTFDLQTQFNNNRNLSVGTFERGVQIEERNLLGIGDRLRVTYNNTDGSNQYGGGYTFPLNANDGTLGVNFRWGENEIVQSSFESIDIDIESRNYDLTWRQPLIQRATPQVSQELAVSIAAIRRESNGTIMNDPQPLTLGADDDGEIRTSVLSFGQEWLQRNRRQVISASSQFNFGIDILDATILSQEPDSQFFSWQGQFAYLRSLNQPEVGFGSTILLRSRLQLAADPLISTEQFSLGGTGTVRGYRQDALLTDSGFFATAEVRLPIIYFSTIDATLQFTPFIDFGTGWNVDNQDTELSTLIGTGFGLLLQTPENFSARVDWGIPLIDEDFQGNSLQENGIYLQLQYDLF